MVLVRAVRNGDGHRLVGDSPVVDVGNDFLDHLVVRRFSPATVRAYVVDGGETSAWVPHRPDARPGRGRAERSVRLSRLATGPAVRRSWGGDGASTKGACTGHAFRTGAPPGWSGVCSSNRVMRGDRAGQPGPGVTAFVGEPGAEASLGPCSGPVSQRRAPAVRATAAVAREQRSGRSPRLSRPIQVLSTLQDPAMVVLVMVLGGLACGGGSFITGQLMGTWGCVGSGLWAKATRNGSCRSMYVFFTECAGYLRSERPPRCVTPECFVVLCSPTRGGDG